VYQAVNSRDVDAFVAIRDKAKQFFPTIQTIRVPTVKDNLVTLEATLNNGTVVPAAALSEGLLYFLGFAALPTDASSLRAWLGAAAEVLQRRVAALSFEPATGE
jgi:hypothetical protein